MIFNEKAWANSDNLIHWAKQEFKWESQYTVHDQEPRLLTMDAFRAHKKSVDNESAKEDFHSALAKLNTTVSIIPAGCTAYLQVLDISCNKIIKNAIRKAEEQFYDDNFALFRAGKFTTGERRILLTKWVASAWKELHDDHQDTIIRTFESVGLSLNPDGNEDAKLRIRDLPSN